jgi:hypothetical protein
MKGKRITVMGKISVMYSTREMKKGKRIWEWEGGTGRGRRQSTKIYGVTKITTYFVDNENWNKIRSHKTWYSQEDIYRRYCGSLNILWAGRVHSEQWLGYRMTIPCQFWATLYSVCSVAWHRFWSSPPPVQWLRVVKVTTILHLVRRLTMSVATPPVPLTLSCSAKWSIFLCFVT